MTQHVATARVDVDTHVHVYDIFDRVALFRRLVGLARERGRPAALTLTESAGYRAFDSLRRGETPDLSVSETDDRAALLVRCENETVTVVSGRQLVSTERLEVLALGISPDHPVAAEPDGHRSAETLALAVLDAGGVCVLPWSVGKWLGARGQLVERLVAVPALRDSRRFFLGDIAARSWPWPRPAVFDRGVRVLCGTDPLPLAGAEHGVARYGIMLEGKWTEACPWTSLCTMLETADRIVVTGSRDGFARALADQVRVRTQRQR